MVMKKKAVPEPVDNSDIALTNFRMLRSDYTQVKILALQRRQTVQEFLNEAVTAYCGTLGVQLSGQVPERPKPKD